MSENIISVYLKAAVNHLRTFNFAAIAKVKSLRDAWVENTAALMLANQRRRELKR